MLQMRVGEAQTLQEEESSTFLSPGLIQGQPRTNRAEVRFYG